ncbi:hypothetical protein [Micromonospora sp. SH-82]|uniref:hypothetical protein n=1 Tax=Micromonospora sp. SH-82 TaxID=3132938 RepID=UPI003EBD9BBE
MTDPWQTGQPYPELDLTIEELDSGVPALTWEEAQWVWESMNLGPGVVHPAQPVLDLATTEQPGPAVAGLLSMAQGHEEGFLAALSSEDDRDRSRYTAMLEHLRAGRLRTRKDIPHSELNLVQNWRSNGVPVRAIETCPELYRELDQEFPGEFRPSQAWLEKDRSQAAELRSFAQDRLQGGPHGRVQRWLGRLGRGEVAALGDEQFKVFYEYPFLRKHLKPGSMNAHRFAVFSRAWEESAQTSRQAPAQSLEQWPVAGQVQWPAATYQAAALQGPPAGGPAGNPPAGAAVTRYGDRPRAPYGGPPGPLPSHPGGRPQSRG